MDCSFIFILQRCNVLEEKNFHDIKYKKENVSIIE